MRRDNTKLETSNMSSCMRALSSLRDSILTSHSADLLERVLCMEVKVTSISC